MTNTVQIKLNRKAKIRLPAKELFSCLWNCNSNTLLEKLNSSYFIPNINITDTYGRTPLFRAISKRCITLAELFMQHGADPHIVAYKNYSSYTLSTGYTIKLEPQNAINKAASDPTMLNLLLKYYSDLNLRVARNPFIDLRLNHDITSKRKFVEYAIKSKQINLIYEPYTEHGSTFTILEWTYLEDKRFYDILINEYKLKSIKNLDIVHPCSNAYISKQVSKSKKRRRRKLK